MPTRRQRHREAKAFAVARTAVEDACKRGDLPVLQKLYESFPDVLTRVTSFYVNVSPFKKAEAAQQWHVLQWAWEHAPHDPRLLYAVSSHAASQDRWDQLAWFAERGAELDWVMAFQQARYKLHLRTMEWLRQQHGQALTAQECSAVLGDACNNGRLDVCDWVHLFQLVHVGEDLANHCYARAATHNHVLVIDWLFQHYPGFRLNSDAWTRALIHGQWEAFHRLEALGCATTPSKSDFYGSVWRLVVRKRQRTSVDELFTRQLDCVEHGFERTLLLQEALDTRDLDFVQWWCTRTQTDHPYLNSEMMTKAVKSEATYSKLAERGIKNPPPHESYEDEAVKATRIREWLMAQKCPVDQTTYHAAVEENCLRWVKRWERPEWLTADLVVRAIHAYAWDALGYLLRRGAPWSPRATAALVHQAHYVSFWWEWALAFSREHFQQALKDQETGRDKFFRPSRFRVDTALWLWEHDLCTSLLRPLVDLEHEILHSTFDLVKREQMLRRLVALKHPLRPKSQRILARSGGITSANMSIP